MSERRHDVLVFGASGFVGELTAKYLAEHGPKDVAYALGGRSREKLEAVRSRLGVDWPVVVADSSDEAALAALAASATVVATTVGPYHRYGLPLVRACAAAGTHYADLTGEVLFMRRSIDECHAAAVRSGARIVHTCGFDSIPSDLGVALLAEHAAEHGLGTLGETTFVVKAVSGGASGGTIDSLRGQLDEAKRNPASRKVVLDLHALSPDRGAEPRHPGERDPLGVVRDPALGGYLAPFVMGLVNSRVVRRSNALQGHRYGPAFRYRELMLGGDGPAGAAKAAAMAGGLGALVAGLALPGTRQVLDRVLPDPGEGPSEAAREKGFFRIDVRTTTSSGARLVCEIAAPGDPGYKATAVMLGEAALALALDAERLPSGAGVLTPATGIGSVLAERLRAAGHRYDVVAA